MKRVALKVGYIGDDFHGFQRQPELRTVEGELIATLKKLDLIESSKSSRFAIAGRTDRGVHSLGNVISFQTDKEVIINQINHKLPDDIKLLAKAPVRYGFKPRYALLRQYRYFLLNDSNVISDDLNIDSIVKIAKLFEGTHDFTNFSKRSQKITTPMRKIEKINIKLLENSSENFNLQIDIFGESFLWNMVRKIMRVFQDFIEHKIELNDINELFNPNNIVNMKLLAPENLILMDIAYNNINFQYDDYAVVRFKKILIERILNYKNKSELTNHILNSVDDLGKL
ncbi:tRNA pseudouridine(38-40) synthase TruA [Methanobrevibacter filiformis]|uniref:tRNA pseudouridine synthase A n=1 Tax=Methanobrevibacter filiformis TaxID=55758 RepID=A0A166C6K8_9EURY|nr:tRNA pseudouridine(38-40) synthase TruA [Methanobrevibacter filiformis]KZX11697.1 tRNA pseudouridine synthase A [Methanobrevibacter filiformis]